MKNKINLFILLISLLIFEISTIPCGADQFNNVEPHRVSLPQNTRKLSVDYKPIKIKMDYTYLESQKKSTELTTKLESVLDKTVSILETLLTVQHANFIYQRTYMETHCGIPVYSNEYNSWGNNYDLVIFPYFNDSLSGSTVQAAATACIAITQTMQPKMGIIMVNPGLDFSHTNSEKFLELLFLHEMSHVLIFHPSFFIYLNLITDSIVNNERIYYINSPKVLEKAKKHFGCNSVKGIPLENYGGLGSAGSHWESRYMLGDYMIATDYPEIVISDISLAVFEDSGFYKVNYYTGGLFRFGKGEGCNFLNQKCIQNGGTFFANEFCIKSQEPFCTAGHLSKGHCYMAKYNSNLASYYQYFSEPNVGGYAPADYCPISFDNLYYKSGYYFVTNCRLGRQNTIHSDYGETIGENSICVESSLVPTWSSQNQIFRSICYSAECDKTNKKVILNIGSAQVSCPIEGGKIENPSGFKGKIICPDYNSICTSNEWCNDPIDCIEKKIVADDISYDYSYVLPTNFENESKYINSFSLFSSLLLIISLLV